MCILVFFFLIDIHLHILKIHLALSLEEEYISNLSKDGARKEIVIIIKKSAFAAKHISKGIELGAWVQKENYPIRYQRNKLSPAPTDG